MCIYNCKCLKCLKCSNLRNGVAACWIFKKSFGVDVQFASCFFFIFAYDCCQSQNDVENVESKVDVFWGCHGLLDGINICEMYFKE